jgi:dTDP-N-acetylfucosamine:lipid II N-acetylfucosaminyltransferase
VSGEILHLFNWDRKFTPPFRDLIWEHFREGPRHRFIVYGDVDRRFLAESDDTVVYGSVLQNAGGILRAMNRAEKVILHNLFNNHLLYLLSLQPWLLGKCCWVLWGGDLYIHQATVKNWRWKKDELFRKFVFSRLGLITTTVPGDYRLAQNWYGAKGKFVHNLMYPSHLFRQSVPVDPVRRAPIQIHVGNSADPSNHHKEIIDKLASLDQQEFIVYVPLSYGQPSYRDEIIAYGRQKLGKRFVPMTEFMASREYDRYMDGIDIAIFNHRRQQGMGNTIALLGMGKTVWLRSDVTPWDYFTSIGLKLYDAAGTLSLGMLSAEQSLRNRETCRQHFTKAALLKAWGTIFNNSFDSLPRLESSNNEHSG